MKLSSVRYLGILALWSFAAACSRGNELGEGSQFGFVGYQGAAKGVIPSEIVQYVSLASTLKTSLPSQAGEMGEDTDGDGVYDACDLYPENSDDWTLVEPLPEGFTDLDEDDDGIPDDCGSLSQAPDSDSPSDSDSDQDSDGVADSIDNCPSDSNPDQALSPDGVTGEACYVEPDTDEDSDGVGDSEDNCPTISNADQALAPDGATGAACYVDPNGESLITALNSWFGATLSSASGDAASSAGIAAYLALELDQGLASLDARAPERERECFVSDPVSLTWSTSKMSGASLGLSLQCYEDAGTDLDLFTGWAWGRSASGDQSVMRSLQIDETTQFGMAASVSSDQKQLHVISVQIGNGEDTGQVLNFWQLKANKTTGVTQFRIAGTDESTGPGCGVRWISSATQIYLEGIPSKTYAGVCEETETTISACFNRATGFWASEVGDCDGLKSQLSLSLIKGSALKNGYSTTLGELSIENARASVMSFSE